MRDDANEPSADVLTGRILARTSAAAGKHVAPRWRPRRAGETCSVTLPRINSARNARSAEWRDRPLGPRDASEWRPSRVPRREQRAYTCPCSPPRGFKRYRPSSSVVVNNLTGRAHADSNLVESLRHLNRSRPVSPCRHRSRDRLWSGPVEARWRAVSLRGPRGDLDDLSVKSWVDDREDGAKPRDPRIP